MAKKFLKRDIEIALKRYVKFPVVAILGPRQSGKTTLSQNYFKKHTFLSFEEPSIRNYAMTDPKGFLKEYENKFGIILDEFQYVPEILSYIQLESDAKDRRGYFVITGSQNFLMNQAITQSLAGRVGILTLLPLSLHELEKNKIIKKNELKQILLGSYPRIYAKKIEPQDLYPSYVQTYVERDVRQLINVGDLNVFIKFLSLCAGRTGQLLNLSEIAGISGITAPTAQKWLSILEANYIVFLLQPHFQNFNKRLIKTAKLYFYDTGLACNLLKINNIKELEASPFRGALFETFILSDLKKQFFNRGRTPPLYFWRDANGRIEVDCVIERANQLIPIEIKASHTMSLHFFDALQQWNDISQTNPKDNYVVYAGKDYQTRKLGHMVGWQSAADLVAKIYKE